MPGSRHGAHATPWSTRDAHSSDVHARITSEVRLSSMCSVCPRRNMLLNLISSMPGPNGCLSISNTRCFIGVGGFGYFTTSAPLCSLSRHTTADTGTNTNARACRLGSTAGCCRPSTSTMTRPCSASRRQPKRRVPLFCCLAAVAAVCPLTLLSCTNIFAHLRPPPSYLLSLSPRCPCVLASAPRRYHESTAPVARTRAAPWPGGVWRTHLGSTTTRYPTINADS